MAATRDPSPQSPRRVTAYAASFAAGAAAVLLRLALLPAFPSSSPSLTLFVAVALTSVAFGIGPGMVAVATGLAGTVLLVLPSLSGPGLAGPPLLALLGVSALNNTLIAILGGLQYRTRRRAERVEAKSVVSEAEYRATFELSAVGQAQGDPATGRILRVNRRFCEITGYTEAELLARDFLEITHPDDRDADRAAWRHLVESGDETRSGEKRYVRPDGQAVWVSFAVAMLRDERGLPRRMLAAAFDISARRAAEAERAALERELDAERARLLTLLRELPAGVAMRDAEGRLLYSNPEAERLMGAPVPLTMDDADPVYGAMRHPDGSAFAFEELPGPRAIREHTTVRDVEMMIQRPDGTTSLVSVGATPVNDAEGRLTALVSVFVDLTERRQAEEAARRSQRLEAMGQLAAGIAHDTNNMMAAVLGYAHMVRRADRLPEALGRDLDEIIRAAERTSHLTRQLLTFSRRQLVTPETFELDVEVASTRDLLVRSLGTETVLVLEPAAERCWVTLDRTQLVQVLLNLALNARDAMPGGGRLTISTRGSADRVLLEVRDTGTGMDDVTRQRAVEPFFTTKDAGRGTGLGLSTVHGIVTQAGGTLELASRPGAGTTVRISLPAVPSPEAAGAAAEDGDGTGRRSGGRVLVVDDESMVRELTTRMLTDAGYQVVSAGSGAEALRSLSAARFDLLVTDLTMPEMSGRDLALRARGDRPDLPVLFITGHHAADLEGLTASRATVVYKPFSPEVLAAAAERLLNPAAGRRPSHGDLERVPTQA